MLVGEKGTETVASNRHGCMLVTRFSGSALWGFYLHLQLSQNSSTPAGRTNKVTISCGYSRSWMVQISCKKAETLLNFEQQLLIEMMNE